MVEPHLVALAGGGVHGGAVEHGGVEEEVPQRKRVLAADGGCNVYV